MASSETGTNGPAVPAAEGAKAIGADPPACWTNCGAVVTWKVGCEAVTRPGWPPDDVTRPCCWAAADTAAASIPGDICCEVKACPSIVARLGGVDVGTNCIRSVLLLGDTFRTPGGRRALGLYLEETRTHL